MSAIVSLCTGTGGLDMGVEWAAGELGTAKPGHPDMVCWFSEFDDDVAEWYSDQIDGGIAFPLGDLKQINWDDAVPQWASGRDDLILTAGYPCQPFSQAGKKLGDQDPRHLWPEVLRAIRELRPQLVVLENVRGHLRLGFDQVLADLAALGFDAEWSIVRASDVGAPHQRARLFVTAWPAESGYPDLIGRSGRTAPGQQGEEGSPAGREVLGRPLADAVAR